MKKYSIWHPCTQMKDFEGFPPLEISHAEGSYIYLNDGKRLLDAISSWWCKSLGHQHPALKAALKAQADAFEHVIFSNTTYPKIIELSDKLTNLTKSLKKVLYAGDGSCAVEMALKMSVHAHQIANKPQKTLFASLQNGYHGETGLALSVSDLGLYRKPYEGILQPCTFIQDIPYVSNTVSDWEQRIETQLNPIADKLAAIIVEPILQGAGGMQIYAAELLKQLRTWTQKHNVFLIADEIMTGFGRTGTALACEHAKIEPDFLCLGKGLTGGYLPMSALLITDALYDIFYDDYAAGKNFLHSHTYSGNALGAAVALACMNVYESEKTFEYVRENSHLLQQSMSNIAIKTGKLKSIRSIGWMVAADLQTDRPRAGFEVFKAAVKLGAFLRPLGNTIYWLPPLNATPAEISELADITEKALEVC